MTHGKLGLDHSVINRSIILDVVNFTTYVLGSRSTDKEICKFIFFIIARSRGVTKVVVGPRTYPVYRYALQGISPNFRVVEHSPSLPILVSHSADSEKLIVIV